MLEILLKPKYHAYMRPLNEILETNFKLCFIYQNDIPVVQYA